MSINADVVSLNLYFSSEPMRVYVSAWSVVGLAASWEAYSWAFVEEADVDTTTVPISSRTVKMDRVWQSRDSFAAPQLRQDHLLTSSSNQELPPDYSLDHTIKAEL